MAVQAGDTEVPTKVRAVGTEGVGWVEQHPLGRGLRRPEESGRLVGFGDLQGDVAGTGVTLSPRVQAGAWGSRGAPQAAAGTGPSSLVALGPSRLRLPPRVRQRIRGDRLWL